MCPLRRGESINGSLYVLSAGYLVPLMKLENTSYFILIVFLVNKDESSA